MRRNIITVALFAVLSTMAVSCQKENLEGLSIASHGALTKDVQTFTTTSQSEAIAWTKEMVNQGYTVDTTYKDGVYICVAIRK